jgi:glucose/mannose transport system substrate-binding protein
MKHIPTALFAAAFAAIVPGIAHAADMKAEVLHWWTSGGESAAIKEIADRYKAAGGEWIDTAIATGEAARAAGINRIVGGNPPTVMQFNTGKQFEELVTNGFLSPLDKVAEENKWKQILPGAIIEATSRDGKFYAAPVNIHGQNWLWYNIAVLKKAGVEPPKTFGDIVAAAPKLKAAGVIPFAHGAQDWQDQILFDAVLIAEAGKDTFQNLYGKADANAAQSAGFKKAAETFRALSQLADEGSAGRNWNDTTGLVITGKAAMQHMGDWAKGEFIAANMKPGEDYGCVVMPGGYVMGGDVFVFPKVKDAAHQAAQVKIADLMLSPETQIAFNTKKGSVPVRLDLDVSSMDMCAQIGMKALKDPVQQVPSGGYIASPDRVGAVRDVITQFWSTKSMTTDEFVSKIVTALKSAS